MQDSAATEAKTKGVNIGIYWQQFQYLNHAYVNKTITNV